jgi:radical SAM superfamily enzyme YgiQ (UPF0313 family)
MAHILLVDLNNFAHYPSIAVGLLTASLRQVGHTVRVFSPLAHGVKSLPREMVETRIDALEQRISFSTHKWLGPPRKVLGRARGRWRERKEHGAMPAFREMIAQQGDLLLISAYTDSLAVARGMCATAAMAGIPVVIGGPIFSQAEVSREWARLPGVRAVVGAEFERQIVAFCRDVLAGADLASYPGSFTPDGKEGATPAAERNLDDLLIPDYTDFPWDRYESRIIPIQMGRGCGWGHCRFCGDIVTANGRGYRTRRVGSVLAEMKSQSERHESRDFVFLDLKLNSHPDTWRKLVQGIAEELPGSRWIGSVHVQGDIDNGLERQDLEAARAAGMLRLTFGMESGSQRVLDSMGKGTCVERNKRFVCDASAAGLSVRTTIIQGYPGEAESDLALTAELLEELNGELDRVRINRLNVLEGTMLAHDLDGQSGPETSIHSIGWEHEWARSHYVHVRERDRGYRKQMRRVLRASHAINRRPIQENARVFHGLM